MGCLLKRSQCVEDRAASWVGHSVAFSLVTLPHVRTGGAVGATKVRMRDAVWAHETDPSSISPGVAPGVMFLRSARRKRWVLLGRTKTNKLRSADLSLMALREMKRKAQREVYGTGQKLAQAIRLLRTEANGRPHSRLKPAPRVACDFAEPVTVQKIVVACHEPVGSTVLTNVEGSKWTPTP